jgi:hypothetical protein
MAEVGLDTLLDRPNKVSDVVCAERQLLDDDRPRHLASVAVSLVRVLDDRPFTR